MSSELLFSLGDATRAPSVEELRRALDDEMGQLCSVDVSANGRQLVIEEIEATLRLVFDEDGKLIASARQRQEWAASGGWAGTARDSS